MPGSTVCQLLCTVLLCGMAIGQADEPEKKDDKLTLKRYELMYERMASVKVAVSEGEFPEKFADKPIFRYTDPARSYVAAALWKLGDKGRPLAIISTELHRQFYGTPRIVYEYLSLTPMKFQAIGDDVNWTPEGTTLEFKPVPKTEMPAESPKRRLQQLRAIAKRFAGEELVGQEKCQLRVLPQPIDRYVPSDVDRADGAIFIAAFGTNPEALLLIESDGKSWKYAAGRLAGATKISLSIDDAVAWEGAPVTYSVTSSYTASNAPAKIPGIAPDGTEIDE